MASTFLVIGLGRFGTNLALRLMHSGNEVMVLDSDEELVNHIAPQVTQAKIGDCMDEEVLRSLDPASFDFCFVCISENFQSSMETTSLLKELGAPMVVAKADRDLHAKLLHTNDKVIGHSIPSVKGFAVPGHVGSLTVCPLVVGLSRGGHALHGF